MNISSTGANDPQAISQTGGVEAKRMQLQMMMLRKSLDGQQQQAEELTREMEGKGQVIDMRV
jgi:hypothetical protein